MLAELVAKSARLNGATHEVFLQNGKAQTVQYSFVSLIPNRIEGFHHGRRSLERSAWVASNSTHLQMGRQFENECQLDLRSTIRKWLSKTET